MKLLPADSGRNIRSVWTITPKPFKGAHFATFPPQLVERCVKAGTSEHGACPECGKPWERVTKATGKELCGHARGDEAAYCVDRAVNGPAIYRTVTEQLGFRQSCQCPPAEPVPCLVLDPFAGAGTVGLVCKQLGRSFIGCDINPEYVRIARKRINSALSTQHSALKASA